ncbi:MAG: hypothetical protein HYR67_14880 [Bacteroidetes bacterium]|nr:hypothetical protein [Bacteroidota bacterium]
MDAIMRGLHFLAVLTWIGGMMFQLIALQPFLRLQDISLRLPILFPIVRRFMMMTWSSITLLLLSGSDMVIRVIVDQKVSLGSRLGMLLLLKWMLFGLMLVVFGFLFFRYFFEFRIHYRALLRKPDSKEATQHYQAIEALLPPMRNLTLINLVLGLSIIFVVEFALYP